MKLERLAELNALLNMDEKGDNALDMGDDEPDDENGEQSAQAQEGEPDRAEDIQAVAEEPLKTGGVPLCLSCRVGVDIHCGTDIRVP